MGICAKEDCRISEKDSDLQFKLDMRQLFNTFKQKTSVNTQLMKQARKSHREYFGISTTESFSNMVNCLVTERRKLDVKTKDLDPSSYPRHEDSRESLIDKIDRQLTSLKEVAKTFKTNEMRWNESIGAEYYVWCFDVLDTNEACHPEITEVLDDMYRLAQNGKYKFGGMEFNEAVKAVIDKLRSDSTTPQQ